MRNIFLQQRLSQNRAIYKQQRNYCCSFEKNQRTNCYASLRDKLIVNNKQFWRTFKICLSHKTMTDAKNAEIFVKSVFS